MKLLRYGAPGAERPGLLDAEGRVRDLSAHLRDLDGAALGDAALDRLRELDPHDLPEVAESGRIGPCVAGVGKFVAIGLNYHDHARETGAEPPKEPIVFFKATSCICGPDDAVVVPRDCTKLDWEVELGVVIGRTAKYVGATEALDYVAGYCVVNDVSARDFQLERGGQWVKGKSADTFGPLGPWLVTRDEVPDPQALEIWLELDGARVQNGTTADMIFGVAEIVGYLSRFMTLHPGDVITTGTPAGVGLGMKPPVFLQPGQVMRLGVEGLGEQRQTVRAEG